MLIQEPTRSHFVQASLLLKWKYNQGSLLDMVASWFLLWTSKLSEIQAQACARLLGFVLGRETPFSPVTSASLYVQEYKWKLMNNQRNVTKYLSCTSRSHLVGVEVLLVRLDYKTRNDLTHHVALGQRRPLAPSRCDTLQCRDHGAEWLMAKLTIWRGRLCYSSCSRGRVTVKEYIFMQGFFAGRFIRIIP